MCNRFSYIGYCLLLIMIAFISSNCSDEEHVSATMSGSTTILSGDTAEIRVDLTGNPPWALRYSDGTREYNVLDIESSPFILKVAPTQNVVYTPVSVATFYRNIGSVSGSANIEVLPVRYVTEQTIYADASCWLHITQGYNTGELMDLSTNGQWTRHVYFEFDVSKISKIEENTRYFLRFHIPNTHANAVGKDGIFEIRGSIGSIDNQWTWDTGPKDEDLLVLFNTGTFHVEDASEPLRFEGNVTPLVKQALEAGASKIFFRVHEGSNNKALYYVASHEFSTENMRPAMDVRLRRQQE